jgi:hypothetical protein
MDEKDFNTELAKLFKEERRKEPYYLESFNTEITLLVQSFITHQDAMKQFDTIETVDDFLDDLSNELEASEDEESVPYDRISLQLADFLQADVERYGVPQEGEVQVGGVGIYLDESADIQEGVMGRPAELLEEGMSLIGEVSFYGVAQNTDLDALDMQEHPYDHYEPWLILDDVVLYDAAGNEQKRMDTALIPLLYPDYTFSKVIRFNEAPRPKEVMPELRTYFINDFMTAQYTAAENDLQYNEYTPEETQEARMAHQDELSLYMETVDADKPMALTTHEALFADGSRREVADVTVLYLQPVFMHLGQTWRVYHGFIAESGETQAVIHVLPEDITAIRYLEK